MVDGGIEWVYGVNRADRSRWRKDELGNERLERGRGDVKWVTNATGGPGKDVEKVDQDHKRSSSSAGETEERPSCEACGVKGCRGCRMDRVKGESVADLSFS